MLDWLRTYFTDAIPPRAEAVQATQTEAAQMLNTLSEAMQLSYFESESGRINAALKRLGSSHRVKEGEQIAAGLAAALDVIAVRLDALERLVGTSWGSGS